MLHSSLHRLRETPQLFGYLAVNRRTVTQMNVEDEHSESALISLGRSLPGAEDNTGLQLCRDKTGKRSSEDGGARGASS